jgi:energy-coupling factor transporter ATP-binding protein EcfA2
MDLELIGITLQGPPPIGRVHLRFESGLSVLYGLNGAGKSSVLKAMRAALTGIRGESLSALHVRYSDPMSPIDLGEDDSSPSALLARSLEQWLKLVRADFSLSTVTAESGISALVSEILVETGNLEYEKSTPGIVQEVSRQGVFTLLPTGATEPEWSLFIAGVIDETTPVLRECMELERRRAGWKTENLEKRAAGVFEDQSALQEALDSAPPWHRAFPMLSSWVDTDGYPWRPGDPPWVPCAIEPCDEFRPGRRFIEDLNAMSDSQLIERTANLVGGPVIIVTEQGKIGIAESAERFLTQLSSEATEIISLLLVDAPVLKCEFRDPEVWVRHHPLHWLAFDRPSLRWVLVDQLSDSQRRWAIFAISLALLGPSNGDEVDWDAGHTGDGRVLILDEPERGLHARAQRQLAQGLAELSSSSSWTIIAATHSSAFLDNPDADLFHVSRDGGETQVVGMTTSIRKVMEDSQLGIEPSEMLQMIRAFLVVEGVHDQVVIEGLLGDELDNARVRVVPMGGTHALNSVVDAQLMFDYTSAVVVIALDRLRLQRVELNWNETRDLVRQGQVRGAYKSLKTFKERSQTSEEEFLYEFLELAIKKSKTDRVEVFGFAKPDILQYLDAQEFVEGEESWDALVRDWNHRGNFKQYLISRGARINSKSIAGMVERMNRIPLEFIELLHVCRSAASGPNSLHE